MPNSSASLTSTALPPVPEDNRFRLLLVEDDETRAGQIMGLLSKTGFECRRALDDSTALAAYKEAAPHLVLIHFTSENFDGDALCKWVREYAAIPILLIGPNDEPTEVRGFKIGADDYLSTPLRPAILLSRVVAQLRRAYRYNSYAENPFGLNMESESTEGQLPSGWAECEMCGHRAPAKAFEKEDYLGNTKMVCPQCRESDHVVLSLG